LLPVLMALVALAGGALPAAAQDNTWVETRFHRVHLQNGNFIDGHILANSDRDIRLQLQVGEMTIRKGSIDRIELLRMRSLREPPALVPLVKKGSAAAAAAEEGSPQKKKMTFTPAEASAELIADVASYLSRLKIARNDQRDALIEGLAGLDHAGPYLASLLPTLDEEACYLVRSAMVRAKDARAVPYLIIALESDRAYVRINALTLLGLLGNVTNAPDIRPSLMDRVPAVKASAIETLQQLSDGDSLELIADWVGDTDDAIRVAAITASLELGRRHDRMEVVANRIRRNLPGSLGRVAKELLGAAARSRRTELWEPAASFLQDSDTTLRRAALNALEQLAAPDSAGAVVARLRLEDDARTLVDVIKTVAKLKSTEAVVPLIELLRKREPNIVRAAAAALATITRQQFGDDPDIWWAWWERSHPK
jgi:HEAT repeat protein